MSTKFWFQFIIAWSRMDILLPIESMCLSYFNISSSPIFLCRDRILLRRWQFMPILHYFHTAISLVVHRLWKAVFSLEFSMTMSELNRLPRKLIFFDNRLMRFDFITNNYSSQHLLITENQTLIITLLFVQQKLSQPHPDFTQQKVLTLCHRRQSNLLVGSNVIKSEIFRRPDQIVTRQCLCIKSNLWQR